MGKVTINNATHQKCPKCQKVILEQIGSQLYCSSCNYLPKMCEHQMKVVPDQYQSNSQTDNNKKRKKIMSYLNMYGNIVGIHLSMEEKNSLTNQVLYLKQTKGINSKGLVEKIAAVLYYVYKQEINCTIKQYCDKLGLVMKKFNKAYLLYSNHRNDWQSKQSVVKQQINEQQSESQLSEDLRRISKKLYKIFDKIFQLQIPQNGRKMVINRISEQVMEFIQKHEIFKNQRQDPENLELYVILKILKDADHKISFVNFKKILEDNLQIRLDSKKWSNFCKKWQKVPTDEAAISITNIQSLDV